ncbi:cyclopropane-fatty-acyl-phospholipid synthase family protein [Rhizobium sp. SSA_523]|uniref:SAM-dependent methyltransferase n=1 Tax=Rhizobium sp. SSA_523 TaxID=2952477 RepID=UPI0020911887|nr:cyclopropane-fatty-acyl-phospholipid synthase family protein [Rhizobium sp. SSA_523]MCO5732821.1 cyclopropane-fatty-acyl-phospholipid synthase family protein [Rhizobium sp. SSA_523]WKC23561.1 cyclopropane-fatty-acyl-phospholipid synthase family protein [Rhizobium sp. SSA_523]
MTHADHGNPMLFAERAPFWERLICRMLAHTRHGRLTIIFPSGREHHFGEDKQGPKASIHVIRPRALRRILSGGGLGFARSYMDGDWTTPDLSQVLDLAIGNEKDWAPLARPLALVARLAHLRHRLRRNSKSGSRRNIAFHYDLGNSFYRLWLDRSMTYSAAIYADPQASLEEAQREKNARIIRELAIGPDDHVLEIGCGWGGFMEQAIRETGCRVTGLTLSKEQAAFAKQRLADAGCGARAEIRLEDYRDCRGRFSKIVSIEMFEAVGEEHWSIYFDQVRRLLIPSGQAMIQVITIDESRFDHYRRHADFIQTYIFPGGMLPTLSGFDTLARSAGLSVSDCFRFGRDYERTLLDWDRRFRSAWSAIAPMGFDPRFLRMWHYYLHYCAAGFRTGRIDVAQFRLHTAAQ